MAPIKQCLGKEFYSHFQQISYDIPIGFFMAQFTVIFMILAMLSVMGALVWGLITMSKGGGIEGARKSNRLMQWRIYLQGVALALFAVVLLLAKQ